MTSAGKETILHSFTTSDGIYPESRLIRDSAGNLYGTTTSGGAHNSGTVITLDGTGKRIRLFSFQPWNGSPNSPLVRDSAGNLYGSTCGGGTLDYGTAFEIVNSTNKRSQLFSFGTTEGACPGGHIAMDSAGNLYGTTSLGYHAFGTVWELNISSGVETVLYAFDAGDPAEGQAPVAGVIRDTAGNLYGTASSGGDLSCGSGLGCGVVFEGTP